MTTKRNQMAMETARRLIETAQLWVLVDEGGPTWKPRVELLAVTPRAQVIAGPYAPNEDSLDAISTTVEHRVGTTAAEWAVARAQEKIDERRRALGGDA